MRVEGKGMDVGARFPLPGEPTVTPELYPARALTSTTPLQVDNPNSLEVVPPVEQLPVPTSRATAQAARLLANSNITLNLDQAGTNIAPALQNVVRLINQTTINPVKATNSQELIQAAVMNEKLSTLTANKILRCLVSTVPLSQQPKPLKDAERLANDMGQITLALLELPCEFYLEHASNDVQSLAAKLTPCIMERGTKYENAERQLLNKAETFVIVSLMKVSLSPNGAEFVKTLNDTLTKNGHKIELQIRKKVNPSSLLAYYELPQLACIVKSKNPPDVIKYSADKVAQEIGGGRRRNSAYFSPNQGCSSRLGFPVWPKNKIDTLTDEGRLAMEELLHSMTAEEAFGRIVSGGFSFTKDAQMFYTPAHIEVSHELIHVWNNSLGVNTENVEMSERTKRMWSNEEERTTITGCHEAGHSENSLGADYKLEERYGHAGLPISELSNPEILSKTPGELSGLHDLHDE